MPIEEDLRFSDETIEDVMGLTHETELAGEKHHDLTSKELGTEHTTTTHHHTGELGATPAQQAISGNERQELAGTERQELGGGVSEKI